MELDKEKTVHEIIKKKNVDVDTLYERIKRKYDYEYACYKCSDIQLTIREYLLLKEWIIKTKGE